MCAEWFMEGLLHRLLDKYDPVSRKCLQQAVFYVVRHPLLALPLLSSLCLTLWSSMRVDHAP